MKNLKIKIALIEKGETQYRLAQILECDPSVVSRIVNGWIQPDKETKNKISKFLGKPVNELFPESNTAHAG
jgi:DNA-binding XRE family transcriptional regulator